MKRFFLVFFLVAVVGLFSAQTWAKEKTPVKLLGQAVLSGKIGSLPETGWGYADGAEYINQQGGINGHKFEVILEDFQYDQALCISNYTRVVNAQPKNELLFVSGYHTGCLLSSAERVKEDHMPWIDGSMATQIFDENVRVKYPYYFSVGVSYGDQIGFMFKFIKETLHKGEGKPKVAFVYLDAAAGRDPLNKMKIYAKKFDINLVLEEPVTFTTTDYTPVMIKIRRARADYAIFWCWSVPAGTRFLKAAKNYLPNTKIFGLSYFAWELFFHTTQEAFDGVYSVSPYPRPGETDNPLVKSILGLAEKKGRKIKVWDLYLQSWLMDVIAAEGARRAEASGDLTRDGVRTALENMTDWKAEGMYYGKPLDYSMHCLSQARMLKADFKSKSLVPVSDWLKLSDYLK